MPPQRHALPSRGGLGAQPVFLRPQFGREGIAESPFAFDPGGSTRPPVDLEASTLGADEAKVKGVLGECRSSNGAGHLKATIYVEADGSVKRDLAIPAFGYKSHIGIDRRHGFIRRQKVTDAAAQDGLGCLANRAGRRVERVDRQDVNATPSAATSRRAWAPA